MKSTIVTCCLLAFMAFSIQEEQAPTIETRSKNDPVDITQQYVEFHDTKKWASPPTEFRQGHVEPREFDLNAIKKTKLGYEIQLPSGAPIPTITYYQGCIYASGGFHSNEFYCFNADSGKPVWGITVDDDGPSAAVCEDGVCVFNTESCTLFAVDSNNGKMLWSWWLGDPLMSTPTISNGKVFTSYPVTGGDGYGNNAAIQQETDNRANDPVSQQIAEANQAADSRAARDQEAEVQKKSLSPPTNHTHALACFDLKSGKILWQRWLDSDVMSAPIADGDELFVTTFGGNVYKFKQDSGEILSATQMRATTAPTIVCGKVVVSQRGDDGKSAASESLNLLARDFASKPKGKVLQLNKADYLDKRVQQKSQLAEQGQKLDAGNGFSGGAPASANADVARNNIGQASVSTLQAYQGSRSLVVRDRNYHCPGDKIVCNDLEGNQKWSIKLDGKLGQAGGFLAAPPIFAGNQILVSTLSGQVLQVNPEDGSTTKRHQVGSPLRFPPIVHDGKIYVGTQNGKVVCVDTQDKSLTGWTTWGGNSSHNKSGN